MASLPYLSERAVPMPDEAEGFPPEEPVTPGSDTELAHLRRKVADYENAINWNTSCLSCATVLDSSIRDYERAERAEEELAQARADLARLKASSEAEIGRLTAKVIALQARPTRPRLPPRPTVSGEDRAGDGHA